MRAVAYLDQAFWRSAGEVFAARSFVIFLGAVARHFDQFTVTARLSQTPADSHYRLPGPARFAPLPYYSSAARPVEVIRAARESMSRFDALLDDCDVAWLLGPHPFALAFAQLAARRDKRVVLGVRQDLPEYVRNRRPNRPDMRLAATALELSYRRLARRHGAIVVGSELAHHYSRAARLLEIWVSLVSASDVVAPPAPRPRRDRLRLLSVGRIDAEKNPLMLVDVLERLGDRYELVVCGDGPLESELIERAVARGVGDRLDMRGHVPMGDDLMALYRDSDVLLHVSWTEGVPQVLLEAFAAAIPVVATDVGGVAGAARSAAVLIPPGDPDAAATAVERVVEAPELRDSLVAAGHRLIQEHTIEAEAARVASFLKRPDARM